MPGKSSPQRPRRILRSVLLILAGLLILTVFGAWLLLVNGSPLAHSIFRDLGRDAVAGTDFTIALKRAGFGPFLDNFTIQDFRCEGGRYVSLTFSQLSFHHRLRPLLRSRLSLKSIELNNLAVHIDSTQPLPRLTDTPIPITLDTERFPPFDLNNVFILYRLMISTSGPPADLILSNVSVEIRFDRSETNNLPLAYHLTGDFCVDQGRPASFEFSGRLNPDSAGPDNLDLDLDAVVKSIHLPDLNTLISNTSPFFVKSGEMDYYLDARCRNGRLSGLASILTRAVNLERNPAVKEGKLTRMTFETWQGLVRRKDGSIEADCSISGTLLHPVIPLGAVLREQAKAAGRNVASHLLEIAPSATTKKISRDIQEKAEDRKRYDDILKINRYPDREKHFELARHYELVVRNEKQALEEYRKQVDNFPKETELAVRSLRAMADLQNLRLDDPRAALTSLRQLVDNYPDHPDTDEVLLEMVDLSIEVKDYPLAARTCDEFDRRCPHSRLADQIKRRRQQIAAFVW